MTRSPRTTNPAATITHVTGIDTPAGQRGRWGRA
jgi:hypothetical protein